MKTITWGDLKFNGTIRKFGGYLSFSSSSPKMASSKLKPFSKLTGAFWYDRIPQWVAGSWVAQCEIAYQKPGLTKTKLTPSKWEATVNHVS